MYEILRQHGSAVRGPLERIDYYMAIDYASIGLRIRHARTEKGLTQEQLAENIGVTRKHLSLVETGDAGISLEMLVAISNTLDAPISELLADNLAGSQSVTDTDLHYIMLDCTRQEERIITKTAQALKAALLEHGI